MLSGEIGLDLFGFAFLDATIQVPGVDAVPTKAKILRIDSGTGLAVVLPFRATDWQEFQRQVAEAGAVSSVVAAPASALRGMPTVEEIIGNGRGG